MLTMGDGPWTARPRDTMRVCTGLRLAEFDARSTTGFVGGKREGKAVRAAMGKRLAQLQEMLYAQGRAGSRRSLLIVLQGMDTSGKGGIGRHVLAMVDPQGVHVRGFGAPTEEEQSHHFLWRVEKQLPPAGHIGVFDRSHYEDVLAVRVHQLAPESTWRPRFEEINEWEQRLVDNGTTVIKCALVISKDEQLARLSERLKRPDKHWKYHPDDLDSRALWDDYRAAYEEVIARTSTDAAPWFAIPADRKWFARLAIADLLVDSLERLDLSWPPADFDIEAEKLRLARVRAQGD
jgi:PPK2 family polyphosphate:nucleotide phosphotransferase